MRPPPLLIPRASTTGLRGALCACGLALAAEARADIYMTRRPDGTLHFTNLPSRRGRNASVVVRGNDTQGAALRTQVVRAEGDPGASAAVPLMSANVRALYESVARDPGRYGRFDTYIREACQLYQLPEPFVRAVIKQESDFNPYSVSRSGAAGLMQLMPDTARSQGVSDVFDPRQNVFGGVRYLRLLANMFNGDLVLTVAAYNAGPNAVVRAAGVPPIEETQHYVQQVLRYYYEFRAGQGVGAPAVAPAVVAAP